jgi:hypothetical protein
LASVAASLEDGRIISGRVAITLPNPAYRALTDKGVVLLMTEETPRFPIAAADGSVQQSVHLWHVHRQPVQVLGVVRYTTAKDGTRSRPVSLDPVVVLGASVVPPGKGLTFRATLGVGDDALVTYEVFGKTTDGRTAKGRFSILRPPPAPTRENSTPVTDPALVAQIRTARKLLGRPVVYDEDLRRLRELGLL